MPMLVGLRLKEIRFPQEPTEPVGQMIKFGVHAGRYDSPRGVITNPAIVKVLEEKIRQHPKGYYSGSVQARVNHSTREIVTHTFDPFGTIGTAGTNGKPIVDELVGTGAGTAIEYEIVLRLIKKFPGYGYRTTRPGEIDAEGPTESRIRQLKRQGREPGVALPLEQV